MRSPASGKRSSIAWRSPTTDLLHRHRLRDMPCCWVRQCHPALGNQRRAMSVESAVSRSWMRTVIVVACCSVLSPGLEMPPPVALVRD